MNDNINANETTATAKTANLLYTNDVIFINRTEKANEWFFVVCSVLFICQIKHIIISIQLDNFLHCFCVSPGGERECVCVLIRSVIQYIRIFAPEQPYQFNQIHKVQFHFNINEFFFLTFTPEKYSLCSFSSSSSPPSSNKFSFH